MTQIEMDFWEFVRQSRKFFSIELVDMVQNRTPNYTRGKFIADALVKLNEAFRELEEARVMDHPKNIQKKELFKYCLMKKKAIRLFLQKWQLQHI